MSKVADRVKESTTTTGTGSVTLAGAESGYRAFSSVFSDGVKVQYVITDGVDWETGIGTFTLSGTTLSRDTVLGSSNAGALVNFSAGAKEVFCDLLSSGVRERLTANRTYYVRTDGNDSNDGLVNTAARAFLTIQKAIDTICQTIDMASFQVTIQVAAGTYTGGCVLKPYIGTLTPIILGDSATPANVVVSVTGASCFAASVAATRWAVDGFTVQTTTSGYGINSAVPGAFIGFVNCRFGACASGHINAGFGGYVQASGNYSIVGAAPTHISVTEHGIVNTGSRTVTITGTPAFSVAYVYGRTLGACLAQSMTFSGTATGPRYNLSVNSAIFTNGAAATYLPGDTAGGTATGGQYF